MKDIMTLWGEAVAFHGHACPGLAIGCRIAADALGLLGVSGRSGDEESVCIAETDACSLDAIQSVWGCTMGKGNLLLKMRGKQAFTFYRRGDAEGMRLCWLAPRASTRPVPGFSVLDILQARILEGLPFPSPGDLLDPGTDFRPPALWADSLLSEPPVEENKSSEAESAQK